MVDEFKQKIAGEITISPDPGKTIRTWREEFGLSQHQLADAMGVSQSVVSDYESGRRKSPGVNVIKKMVDAFIELDMQNGSPVISRYNPNYKLDCIISMDEFPGGVDVGAFINAISGKNLNPDRVLSKSIFGYTIVDSLKAILSLGSDDYLKIYGWNTERALIFTNVHYGRSPMVAVHKCAQGKGVILLEKQTLVNCVINSPDICILPIAEPLFVELYCAYPQQHKSPALETFIQQIQIPMQHHP